MNIFGELGQSTEIVFVVGKAKLVAHVVDVGVLRVEGHFQIFDAIEDHPDVGVVGVTIATELEAQRPIGRHHGSTNQIVVFVDDLVHRRPVDDVEVQNATDGSEYE